MQASYGSIHGAKETFGHINIVTTTILIHGCKPPNVDDANLINLIFVAIHTIKHTIIKL